MQTENLYTPDSIRTYSGRYINVFDPKVADIHISDIAHSLSMQPRFAGHLPKFYSVAQHCVIAAEHARPEDKLQALLHDASEAYMLDIPSPIKNRLPEYKAMEDNLMEVIARRFRFQYPLSQETKAIDKYLLEWEWSTLMLQEEKYGPIPCWTQQESEHWFLSAYHQILK